MRKEAYAPKPCRQCDRPFLTRNPQRNTFCSKACFGLSIRKPRPGPAMCACGCGTAIPLIKRPPSKIIRFLVGHNARGRNKPRAIAPRFWQRVRKTETCWLWTGGTTTAGYGKFWIGGHAGRDVSSHRVAYELLVGPIPSGHVVMHQCDVKLCVNPTHLSVGTHKQNTADMIQKQRAGWQGAPHVMP